MCSGCNSSHNAITVLATIFHTVDELIRKKNDKVLNEQPVAKYMKYI